MAVTVNEMAGLKAENQRLLKEVEELRQQVADLQRENDQLKNTVQSLQGSQVQPTHRNILYSEKKNHKRLPVFAKPEHGAQEVGSLAFGELFAVYDKRENGGDVWLQIEGGDYANQWVLGCEAGTVNCVDTAKYDREKQRIESSAYNGQHFPKTMFTEGLAGTNRNNVCLVSASGDSLWREVNIEMLFRGIATATVFEEAWGGDETFTDWVAYYAVNCVQYGQLRTPLQKRLLVTVKPTGRWREFQPGRCLGPNLDHLREHIGKAQYKECLWLQGMKDQLHVKWEEVEFLTGFAFLRMHCAWTADDCKKAANDRILWVLKQFFSTMEYREKAKYELERAFWLLDEAFDGCTCEETARAFANLQMFATMGVRLDVPPTLNTADAAPLVWGELAAAAAAAAAARYLQMDGAGLVAAGGYCSMSLGTGKLRTWWPSMGGGISAPTLAPSETWAAVTVGYGHVLGLTAAGELHAWGKNSRGQCSSPVLAPGERWVAASAGGAHSLGLTAAGSLRAWGSESDRKCEIPVLPTGERWAAVSAGYAHSLGITDAGTLHAWGNNSYMQCTPPVLPQGERWVAVSAGGYHSLGLTAGGALWAWGTNVLGQCQVPVLASGERWVGASAGDRHSLGLTSQGTLRAWGDNSRGQCDVPKDEQWLAASAGAGHSLGLTSTRMVHLWGEDMNEW